MHSGWTAPYPDGRSTLDALLNGEHIALKGNLNYSLFNEPKINKKLDDLNAEPNIVKAAYAYGQLDQEIMGSYAPRIPTYSIEFFDLHGSKAHVRPSTLYAEFNLVNAWVG
jgi:ABC-type transport system substrate-binding protein